MIVAAKPQKKRRRCRQLPVVHNSRTRMMGKTNWGGVAKNFGGVVLDSAGLIGDALAPVKALSKG